MPYDKIDQLYDALKKDGAVSKSRENFRSKMLAPGKEGYQNRLQLYKALKADGAIDSPTYEEFGKRLGLHAVNNTPAPAHPQPQKPTAAPAQAATPAPNSAPATPQQKDKPLTPAQRQAMIDQVQQMQQQTQAMIADNNERMKNMQQYGFGLGFGQTKKGGYKYNPRTKKFEQTYLTPTGNRYSSKALADAESFRYRQEASKPLGINMNDQQVNAAQKPANAAIAALWKEAEAKYAADRNKNAEEVYSGNPWLHAGREMHIVDAATNSHKNEVSRLTRFDLQKMMDNAWGRVGKQMTASCYQQLKKQYPTASEQQLQNSASAMARQLSDNAVYKYAVAKNTPKSTLEFFAKTAADMNLLRTITKGLARSEAGTTGDMAAYEQAMSDYGKNHRWAQIGGTVTGMMFDPTTYISGGIGSFGGKMALNIGGRIVAKKAATNVGARLFGNTLTGRVVAGVAGGAGNIGAYEGIKEGESQWLHGGHINQETGENEGYSAGDVLKSSLHGTLLGSVTGTVSPLLGNVADKWVKATSNTAGKVGIRAGELATSTVAEGTIFSIPEWISGDGDAMDVWTDNMAMMIGFKGQHMIKSAPRVIAGLRPIADPKTMQERNHNRMNFVERLRKQVDASPRDMAFTKEEREELQKYGYGDLAALFTRTPKQQPKAKARPKSTDGKVMYLDIPEADVEDLGRQWLKNHPEFDGYEAMERLMQDPNVSQSARAKAYYILTGRQLPMGTVTGYTTEKDEHGNIFVKSVTANGEVVTNRRFADEASAKREQDKIMRQAELNSVDVGERYTEAKADNKVWDAAVEAVAPGADPETVKRNYQAAKEGDKDAIANYGQMVDAIDKFMEENRGMADAERPEAIRAAIKEETGVDVDAAIKKESSKRTEPEQAAVEDYLKRLFPEQNQETEQPMSDDEAGAAAIYDQSRLLWDKMEQGDADAKADVDAIVLRMQEALQECEYAFGTDAEMRMAEMQDNPWALANDPELTEDQQNAVLYYINAKAAMDGVQDASNDAMENKRREVAANVERHTHKDNGMVQPATMKVDDKPVYIVKGNVAVLPDGTGIDTQNSDQSIVICDAETGEYKFTSPDQIFNLGDAIDPQAELDEAYANIQAEHESVLGGMGNDESVPNSSESVQETPENVQNEGENVQPPMTDEQLQQYAQGAFNEATQGDGGVTLPQEQVEQMQQHNQRMLEQDQQRREEEANRKPTALERVPINEETGEPMFEKADKETALDALNEVTGGNDANTTAIVNAQVEQAQKTLDALKKKQPTKKAPSLKGSPMAMVKAQQEADANYNTAMEQYNAQVAEAEETLGAWSRIYALMNERKHAIREQQEAERRERDARLHDEAVAQVEEQKRIAAQKAAEQAEVGTHAVNPKIKAKWDGAAKVEGNPNALTLADGSTIRGHYVLTEAGAASASHDINNAFEPTEGFPIDENGESVNDRDYNRFVPQVRRELEKMGYRFELDGKELTPEESLALDRQNMENRDVIPGREGHAPFMTNEDIARINAKMSGKWVGEPKEAMNNAMAERVNELAERLHTPVRIIRTDEEVAALPSTRQRRMKGSFNPLTGEVTIVVPNNANMADVENTFIHEVVGHDGLRVLFPEEEKLNNALDELYNVSKDEIRNTIDRMAQKMYDAEVNRFREKKRKEHEAKGEDSNATYYADMAEVHAEASKKREQFKRDATEEYGADLAGRIGEKGFEKMSAEELTFWGKLKSMLQKALQKLLDGLKIPGKKKWGDKEWAFVLHEAYKRKKNGGKPDVFDAADTEVMRRKTGFGETKFSDGHKKSAQLNEAALKHLEPTDVEHAAKVQQKREKAKEALANVAKTYKNTTDSKGFISDLSNSLGLTKGSTGSGYGSFETPNGKVFTIRVSNHNINAANVGDEPVESIVIKTKRSPNRFHAEDGKFANEYVYFKEDIRKAPAGTLSAIAESISDLLDTGEYHDKTGLAKDNHSPETDPDGGMKFRDGDMGLDETITQMKIAASQANADNWQAKQEAMKAIGGNLNKLRQAMARQREYDLSTVKSITDLAKVLLDNGLLDDLSKYETKRILSAVNNAHGKQDTSNQVAKVMDIMVDNQLRMGANMLGRLLSTRGSRVDARGIEVQGQLDPDGQTIAQVVRKATSLPKSDIEERIAEALNRMGSDDQAVADEAALEYSGLLLAHQFAEDITDSKAEEKALRDSIKQAKEDLDAGMMEKDAYHEYVEAINDSIRQNKIERAEAYRSIVEQVGSVLGGSVERAKQWREAEKQRVEAIHHNANSDMVGRPTDEHHKEGKVQKIANNSAVRFLLAPLGTFDQMLRMFGKKSVNGEGYLWNRYMRGWVDATEREYKGYQNALKTLDEKVSEVFGKNMKWGDLFAMERKMPKATITFWDGGERKDHELTQGNLLYIYMVDKMADGRMKLRRMGITEEDVENIKDFVDPRFLQLADWMQEEFLVGKRNEYNDVHKRMFGASMAAIENYFPLKILANARIEDVDVADDTTDTALPATSTGSIIKRRRNNLALDVMGADAFSVILDHIQQMERWAAFAEFNRDLNTLLSYKHFRNQVMNMSSVYGGGKTLWNNFRNVCSMAAGAYRPPIAQLDKAAVNIAKGVTAAKVSFRVFTALKQFLSMPAYLSDSNPVYLAANIANPIGAWKWSMENLPIFEKRWKSRMAGDPRLMKSEMDWKMWRSHVVEIASRIGMSPNAFVDALTVAIGSHAMYQTKKQKYLRYGYDEEVAEKRAKQDATILFNQTQQSSESAFLSTMQVDRSWLSVLFTIFRNSSMSYTRQLYDAIRNIKHRFEPGYQSMSEEYMAKQMRRDGIDPDKADSNAKSEYRRSLLRDIARIGVFGYILQFAWNFGAYLPYLIAGDDKDEKSKMWDDVINHTMFGSIEGLTGGDVMSSAGQMALNGEAANWSYLVKDMPLASDLAAILQKMPKDKVAAMNDVVNLLVQSGVGVNPQSLTDAVVAIMDYCGDDAETSRECALLIARILNCPQSQTDKIYFDELDATAAEASKMTPAEIAERYAEYKIHRGAPLTGWAYSEEARDSVKTAQQNRVLTKAKEKMSNRMETEATKQLLSTYDEVSKQQTELSKLKKTDRAAYREGMKQLRQKYNMREHGRMKRYKHDMKLLTEKYLRSKSAEERDSLVRVMTTTRDKLLDDIGRMNQQ